MWGGREQRFREAGLVRHSFLSNHVTFLSFVDTNYESLRSREESSISVLAPDPFGLFERHYGNDRCSKNRIFKL